MFNLSFFESVNKYTSESISFQHLHLQLLMVHIFICIHKFKLSGLSYFPLYVSSEIKCPDTNCTHIYILKKETLKGLTPIKVPILNFIDYFPKFFS